MNVFKIGMVIALASATSFAMDQNQLLEAMASQRIGIDKKDIRRGLLAISNEARKELKKSCSVYVQGLASIKGGDCDDTERPMRPGQRGIDPIDEDSDDDGLFDLVMGNPLYDGNGAEGNNPLYEGMAARYADNMFGDFIPMAAEAQDYNSSRSNKPRSIRGDVIGAGARVMGDFSEDLAHIFTGEDNGEYFLETISREMSSLDVDPKFARSIYADFINSLQQVYKKEQRTLKSADVNQSEAIYQRASRKARLSVDALKEIVKTASLITQKQIATGDTVELIGFGSFSISKRSARTGRNPQTGKEIKVAAAKSVVKFKAGAELSKAVN